MDCPEASNAKVRSTNGLVRLKWTEKVRLNSGQKAQDLHHDFFRVKLFAVSLTLENLVVDLDDILSKMRIMESNLKGEIERLEYRIHELERHVDALKHEVHTLEQRADNANS